MFRRIVALLSLAAFGLSGCYSYRLAEPSDVVSGAEVRLRLTADEAARVDDQAGLNGRVLSGSIVDDGAADRWMVEAPVPGSTTRMVQRVTVDRAGVNEIEVKEFSLWRTAVVAVLAGAMIGIVAQQATSGDPQDTEDPGGGPENILIPVFRFSPW